MRKFVSAVATAIAIAALPAALFAQASGTISGRVVDRATQAPLSEAQITLVGTARTTSTDREGRFALRSVDVGTYNVRARRVGYAPVTLSVTVTAGGTATADFALAQTGIELEEVVVSAVTGQQERRITSGTNVGRVDVANLDQGPITKMSDVLQGRVAGVTLNQSVGTSGGGQRIRVRGANSISLSNEPLVFIDGVRATNNKGGFTLGGQDYSRLNDISPEEIENVDVLKGPAASALYGSAGANGVILITTKKGRSGAPVWRSWGEVAQMKDRNPWPDNYYSVQVNPAVNDPNAPLFVPGDDRPRITALLGASAPYIRCFNFQAAAGTCTQDKTFALNFFRDPRTSFLQNGARATGGLSVSGGSDAVTYFLSAGRESEDGVQRPNSIDRLNIRSNLNARIGDKLTTGINAAYIRSNSLRMSNDNSIFSPIINGLLGPAEYIQGMEADTLGGPCSRPGSWFGCNYADQQKYTTRQLVDRFVVGGNSTYTPLSWLRLFGNIGLDYFSRFDRIALDPFLLPIAQSFTLGHRDAQRSNNYLWTMSASGTATFEPIAGLVSSSTLGGAFDRALFQAVECFGVGTPTGTSSCAATTSQFAVDEEHSDTKTVGGFLRQELAWRDRLFISGSVRADNNSGLVRQVSGLAYYPAVNASWVVSREPWFPQSLGFLSQFRVRGGWGQAGQRPGFGDAETFFSSVPVQIGTSNQAGLVLTATGNPALKVERTNEVEGGFDAGLFNDRVYAEFTAFRRRSTDALISRELAPSAGLTATVFQNLGSVRNTGIEAGLNANVLNMENFRLDARFTASTLRNTLEQLGEGINPITTNRGRQQFREGFPAGGYFGVPVKWNDANGDGLLSTSEISIDSSRFIRVRNSTGGIDTLPLAFLGPILPTNSQTLSADVTLFKWITISSLFERRAGNIQQNETEFFRCRTQFSSAFSYGQCAGLGDSNAPLMKQAAFIASVSGGAFGQTPSLYMEKADFVKWRELSVRLAVPEGVGDRFRALRGASIAFAGRNLRTWTDYTGLDPEINEGGGNNFTQAEFNTQPIPRVYTIRLDFRLF